MVIIYLNYVILPQILSHYITFSQSMSAHNSNRSFRFRQFEVFHDRCAMKVGTDGVLLGAWADVCGGTRVLDVGCGSGLVALMVAQRAPCATVVGIDIDRMAVGQAVENVARSPFADRVVCEVADVRAYAPAFLFDHVVSNPPFFEEDTLPPDKARMSARNASALPLAELLSSVSRLLQPAGSFSLILPVQTADRFVTRAFAEGWRVVRSCIVWTTLRKPPRRRMLTLTRGHVGEVRQESLVLNAPDGSRSESYAKLCGDFYL